MSWAEFAWSVEGYEQRNKDEWRRARMLAVEVYNLNGMMAKNFRRITNPEKYLKLGDNIDMQKARDRYKPVDPKKSYEAYKKGKPLSELEQKKLGL